MMPWRVGRASSTYLQQLVNGRISSHTPRNFPSDFPTTYQDWKATNPLDLFEAPIVKTEANPKAHIRRHLSQEALGCGYLVLWLDCDLEGEFSRKSVAKRVADMLNGKQIDSSTWTRWSVEESSRDCIHWMLEHAKSAMGHVKLLGFVSNAICNLRCLSQISFGPCTPTLYMMVMIFSWNENVRSYLM